MPQRIVAIEVARDRVRAAAADRTWNSFQLTGVFESQRASDEPDLSAALGRLLQQTDHPDVVVSSLPGEDVAKRLLELPFADSRRLHQVVPFALEEHLPFPVDGAVVSFVRVGRQDQNSLVVAALASKKDVRSHLELLASAGLDPKTVTLAPYALAALFARAQNGAAPTAHVLIDAIRDSTSIVLLDKIGIPRAIRCIGADPHSSETAAPRGSDSAVLNAARQTVLAHAGDLDNADLVVTGPAVEAARLGSELSSALSLSLREPREFDCSALFDGLQPDLARFATPIAMLLGELPNKPVELLNFRQGEFAFRGRSRGDLTQFYTPAMLAAAMAALALLYVVIGVAGKLHRISIIDREIAAIAAPVLGQKNPSDPMDQLRAGIAGMSKRLKSLGGGLGRDSALNALTVVSRALPSRFPVEMEDFQVDASGLRVTGQADSFATVDQVKRALDQTGYFGTIEVTHAKTGNENDKVEFRLSAGFKDAVARPE
jgi:type II secretory pathway component PulL